MFPTSLHYYQDVPAPGTKQSWQDAVHFFWTVVLFGCPVVGGLANFVLSRMLPDYILWRFGPIAVLEVLTVVLFNFYFGPLNQAAYTQRTGGVAAGSFRAEVNLAYMLLVSGIARVVAVMGGGRIDDRKDCVVITIMLAFIYFVLLVLILISREFVFVRSSDVESFAKVCGVA